MPKKNVVEVKIKADADYTEAKRQTKRFKNDIEKELDDLGDTIDDGLDFDDIEPLDPASLGLGQAESEVRRSARRLKDRLSGVGDGLGGIRKKIVRPFERAADDIPKQFDGVGEKVRGKLGGIGKALSTGVGIGIGAGLADKVVSGFGDALDFGAAQDKLAAQLGLTGAEAEAAGKLAGDLYADAYGDSLEDVGATVQSVFAAFPNRPPEVLKAIAQDALDMGVAFDGSGEQFIALAKQLESQGVVDSAEFALDNLTVAFQQLPGEMQGPLTDAVEEYGVFLDSLGFSTADTFDILTQSAGKGEFALDKTGDALKEFSIRATDLSTASVDAFNAIGLDAQKMGEDVLAGGDTAKGAFDQIVDGLLGIEDPVEQANTAIALFGTPLEDLGVNEIPAFLESLDQTTGAFDDTIGAAGRMGDELNDNLRTKLEALRRGALQNLAKFLSAVVVPAVEKLADVFGQTLGPVISRVAGTLKDAAGIFKTAFAVFSGDETNFDSFSQNLATPLGRFVSQVARVAAQVKEIFGQLFDAISGLFGDGGEGGGLKASFDGILTALTPLVAAVGDFLTVLSTGEGYEDFNQTAVTLANTVRSFARTLIDEVIPAVVSFAQLAGAAIRGFLEDAAPVIGQVVELFTSLADLVIAVVSRIVQVAGAIWSKWGEEITAVVTVAFDLVSGVVQGALDIVVGIIRTVTAVINGDWAEAWEGVKQVLSGAWEIIKAVLAAGLEALKGLFRLGVGVLKQQWAQLWAGLQLAVRLAWQAIFGGVSGGIGRVVGALAGMRGRVAGAIRGIWDPIYNGFKRVIERIRNLWKGLDFKIPEVNIPGLGSVGGGSIGGLIGRLPFFADGNVATSPTLGVFGEYSGARTNPEITTPQSTMEASFRKVLSERRQDNGGSGSTFNMNINVADGRGFLDEVDLYMRRYG